MLKELHDNTGFDFRNVRFNDKTLYEGILNKELIGLKGKEHLYPFSANTMAISEMNTDFTMKFLSALKPKSFYDLIAFSGFTHGTDVLACQIPHINEGKQLVDLIPYRDIIFQQLTKKYGFEPKEAFTISEFVRKGKGISKFKEKLEEKCPKWYVDILNTIKYLFPKAHATAYIMNALRIFYYKINFPQAFYASAINRYGVSNTSNNTFDYIKFFNETNTLEDLQRYHSYVQHQSDNDVKVKNNIRIANIIWEMKLRGFKIEKPDFSSKSTTCTPSKKNKDVILMPLSSIAGVGIETAKNVEIAYQTYGDELFNKTRVELEELRINKDGKDIKAFNKKFLDGYFGEQV